jgi:hypothetical protein
MFGLKDTDNGRIFDQKYDEGLDSNLNRSLRRTEKGKR